MVRLVYILPLVSSLKNARLFCLAPCICGDHARTAYVQPPEVSVAGGPRPQAESGVRQEESLEEGVRPTAQGTYVRLQAPRNRSLSDHIKLLTDNTSQFQDSHYDGKSVGHYDPSSNDEFHPPHDDFSRFDPDDTKALPFTHNHLQATGPPPEKSFSETGSLDVPPTSAVLSTHITPGRDGYPEMTEPGAGRP